MRKYIRCPSLEPIELALAKTPTTGGERLRTDQLLVIYGENLLKRDRSDHPFFLYPSPTASWPVQLDRRRAEEGTCKSLLGSTGSQELQLCSLPRRPWHEHLKNAWFALGIIRREEVKSPPQFIPQWNTIQNHPTQHLRPLPNP